MVRGMAKRIHKSLMVRGLAKRIGWPIVGTITVVVRGMAKAPNGKRSLSLKGGEVFV